LASTTTRMASPAAHGGGALQSSRQWGGESVRTVHSP
jgi:hypothetical protein